MALKNDRKAVFEQLSSLSVLDSLKTEGFLAEVVIGSDIVGLTTEKSDYDILFLYLNGTFDNISSYDKEYRHCVKFIKLADNFVQWAGFSLGDIKDEIMRIDDDKDFSLLASLVKFGLKGANFIFLDKSKDRNHGVVLKKIKDHLREISTFAFFSFLMPKFDKKNGGLSNSFEDKKFSSAYSICEKFWYTAYLGHALLFSSNYDKGLAKRFKDMKYKDGEEGFSEKEEESVINKIKECCNYFASNFPNGIANQVEKLYNEIISNYDD